MRHVRDPKSKSVMLRLVTLVQLLSSVASLQWMAAPPHGMPRTSCIVCEEPHSRILEYPHPLLRAENEDVTEFDDDLKRLTKEMFAIMYASRGVGLAAPQLGINKRLMVFNPEGDPKRWVSEVVLCNPRIEQFSSATTLEEEGCLSFPGFTADVVRSENIKVVWQGLNGKTKRKKLRGWEARVFQHEFDHLDGTLYVDRLKEDERSRIQPDLDALIKAYEAAPVAGPAAR